MFRVAGAGHGLRLSEVPDAAMSRATFFSRAVLVIPFLSLAAAGQAPVSNWDSVRTTCAGDRSSRRRRQLPSPFRESWRASLTATWSSGWRRAHSPFRGRRSTACPPGERGTACATYSSAWEPERRPVSGSEAQQRKTAAASGAAESGWPSAASWDSRAEPLPVSCCLRESGARSTRRNEATKKAAIRGA